MATTAAILQVQRSYIAYYNRPGDPGGVEYWANRLDAGESLNTLINSFANSPEASALYEGVSTADLIVLVYGQSFGRTPDDGGRDYWAGRIDSGELTPGEALLTIVEGASGDDLLIIDNKVDFSVQVTNSFATDDDYNASGLTVLSDIMALIDATVESLSTALSNYVTEEPEPEPEVPAIVGVWNLVDAVPGTAITFTFNEDGTYTHWETQIIEDVDPSGFPGTETGTYSWDASTGVVSFLTVTSDTNGDWGASDSGSDVITVHVDGDTLTLNGMPFVAAQPDTQVQAIVGNWHLANASDPDDNIIFSFNADGTYSHWETGGSSVTDGPTLISDSDNPSGYTGSETGTYSWDESTGMLSILTITSDANGDWGLSDELGQGPSIDIEIVGTTMSAFGGELIFDMA